MIYLTSDLHLFHDMEFVYKPRGFENVNDMNNTIISNWNSIITKDDEVYVLGDLMLNDNDAGIELLKQLNGKIHIILGNHDTDKRIFYYHTLPNVVEISFAARFVVRKYRFFLSHYPSLCSNFDDDLPLKRRVINLCGHSHCNNRFQDMNKGLIYHVELDAHNMLPVSIEEIIEDLKNYKENK